jgi:hypothetical protein
MMQCAYSEKECSGPSGDEKWWTCPVHGARLTQPLTDLCRARRKYFKAWEAGRGPGQEHSGRVSKPKAKPRGGPGSELKALIATWQRRLPWLSLAAKPGCGCNSTVRQMDNWGPDKCLVNLDVIVDRMERTAAKRKLMIPFRKTAARALVRQAIRRARAQSAATAT